MSWGPRVDGELSVNTHVSLLPVCGCKATSCLRLLWPQWAVPSKYQPDTLRECSLPYAVFVKHFGTVMRKVTNTFIILLIRNRFLGPDGKYSKVPELRVSIMNEKQAVRKQETGDFIEGVL